MRYAHKIEPGAGVHLKDFDPAETHGRKKHEAETELVTLGSELTELQEMHYAAGDGATLVILQGLDSAGKDGTIRHVMTYFNPAGCRVESFKAPTPVELAHDFLWRVHAVTPSKGFITIFNRSHYEDVLVARVHKLVPTDVWERRYKHINDFEALLTDNGTTILKFFLYISKDEQRERLLARAEDKDKAWKLSPSDWPEHDLYDSYVSAYEDVLSRCSTEYAPWYLVPADHKWFRNLAVATTLVETFNILKPTWKTDLERRGKEQLTASPSEKR